MATDPRMARTRERVLGAAWELLNEVGFDGVTVELVSERSGVARSTLYRHWRSMPEVLRDALAPHDPPSTLLVVVALGYPDQLVEMDAVAALTG